MRINSFQAALSQPTRSTSVAGKQEAVERLDRLARRAEFWECHGVGKKEVDTLEQTLPEGGTLEQAVGAFEKLFEIESQHTPAPTSATENTYPKLLAITRGAGELSEVVEAFGELIPFERQRLYIDGPGNALKALQLIAESMAPFESWTQNVAEFKRDPQGYRELKAQQAQTREQNRQETFGMAERLAEAGGQLIVKADEWIQVGPVTLARKP